MLACYTQVTYHSLLRGLLVHSTYCTTLFTPEIRMKNRTIPRRQASATNTSEARPHHSEPYHNILHLNHNPRRPLTTRPHPPASIRNRTTHQIIPTCTLPPQSLISTPTQIHTIPHPHRHKIHMKAQSMHPPEHPLPPLHLRSDLSTITSPPISHLYSSQFLLSVQFPIPLTEGIPTLMTPLHPRLLRPRSLDEQVRQCCRCAYC